MRRESSRSNPTPFPVPGPRRFARTGSVLLTAVAVAVSGLVGCGSQPKMDQWRAEANDRWLDARAAIMLDMARHQFETGDLERAEHTVNDALRIDERSAPLTTLAGRIMIERGRLERAFYAFDRAVALDPAFAPAHYYRGMVLQRWQRHAEALDSYLKAYAARADHLPYLLAVAEMEVASGQTHAALARLESKLDYFDQSSALRSAIGQLHILTGHPDRALPHLREAVLIDPDDRRLREDLAACLADTGEPQAAIPIYESLLEAPGVRDGRPDLVRRLASAAAAVGRFEQARSLYTELGRGDHATAQDWLHAGELAWREGHGPAALTAAGRAIRADPACAEAYLLAALIWRDRRDYRQAADLLDRLVELRPGDGEAWLLLAITRLDAGQPAQAATAAQQARRHDPADPRAQRLLSRLGQRTDVPIEPLTPRPGA